MTDVLRSLRPEVAAGGFARDTGGIAFYTRVNALLDPGMTLIDLGAGRGTVFHSGVFSYYEKLAKLQGKVKKVIGLDVDEAIRDHPFLDERHVVGADGALPVADGTADIVVADWVFEHVQDPAPLVRELDRILKPSGWLCARTPNRWGYAAIATSLIPNRLHASVLRLLSPTRHEIDVFPTAFKMNTPGKIREYFPASKWNNYSYRASFTPKYSGKSKLLFKAISLYQSFAPDFLKTDFIIIIQKK